MKKLQALRVIKKSDLPGTKRHIKNDFYETFRFLLDEDATGLTLTDIILSPNIKATYGYEHHIEIAYCIHGTAEIFDLSNRQHYKIEPGCLWVSPKGSQFEFFAYEPTRLICVFNPPFAGDETGFAGGQ